MRKLLLVIASFCFMTSARAADFWAGTIRGWPALKITGQIMPEDYDRFLLATANRPFLLIQMTSPGGNAYAALQIGRTINERRYSTLVANDEGCFSACGIMWLGGYKRFLGERGMIGFHAVYDRDSGAVASAGNALVGAYYAQLHLSDVAIQWLTTASPDSVASFTPAVAQNLGIETFPAGQGDTIVYANAPSTITPPTTGTVSVEPVAPSPQPPMNAYAPPAYQSSPPAVAVETPIDDEEIGAAHRLARAFASRRVYGLVALHDSIEACYRQTIEKQSSTSAEYCIGLDALSTILATQIAQKNGTMLPEYFSQPMVRARFSWIVRRIGGDDATVKGHALKMVKIAFSDIQMNATAVAERQVPSDPCADMGGAQNPFYGLCKAFNGQ